MPYIPVDRRDCLRFGNSPDSAGELNFLITEQLKPLTPAIKAYIKKRPERYQVYNDVLGALMGACLEFVRREFPEYAVYEDKKILEHGDVF